MAIYHLSAQVVQRSVGRNAVAAAAYRSANSLTLTNPYSVFYRKDTEGNSYNHLDVFSTPNEDTYNKLNQLVNNGVEVEHRYNYSRKKV